MLELGGFIQDKGRHAMAEVTTEVLPDAVYFDANVLIATNGNFHAPPATELIAYCQELDIPCFIPDIALQEAVVFFASEMESLTAKASRLKSAMRRDVLAVEKDCSEAIRDGLTKSLDEAGIRVFAVPKLDVVSASSVMLQLPRKKGDIGFKDVIILLAIVAHARETLKATRVLFSTADHHYQAPSISRLLRESGVSVQLVVADDPAVAVEMAASAIGKARGQAFTAVLEELERGVLTALQPHEDVIMKAVETHAKVGMMTLWGLWESERNEEEKHKLENAIIESIDGYRAKRIASASVLFDSKTTPGRARFWFGVEVEFDITISRANIFDELKLPLTQVGELPKRHWAYSSRRHYEKVGVVRTIRLEGSFASEGIQARQYKDFRIEPLA